MYKSIISIVIVVTILLSSKISWPGQQELVGNYAVKEVAQGDTLQRICLKYYGTCSNMILKRVLQANPSLRNSNMIKPGDRIKLPPLLHQENSGSGPAEKKTETTPEPGALNAPAVHTTAKTALVQYNQYPSPKMGEFTLIKWISDDTALVLGSINLRSGDDAEYKLVVAVDGDADYEQDMETASTGDFMAKITVGRLNQDHGKEFVLKLLKLQDGIPTEQISVPIIKKQNNKGTSIDFRSNRAAVKIFGTSGVDKWIRSQSVAGIQLDNKKFKNPKGLVIRNYKFTDYNPDEKYLGRFGRITLYGSSSIAKYLILKGDAPTAKKILDVWCDQVDSHGGIPRSANVVGDTYISPDVRTGDMAYFLGALAIYKAATGDTAYDGTIKRLLHEFFIPQQDPITGLVRGGYSFNGNGYGESKDVSYLAWASAEHNFDLFQSLVLLGRLFEGADKDLITSLYQRVGHGLDTYMWNKETNTFNRGYRFQEGSDKAKALDCSSWGALYLIKQASLASDAKDAAKEEFYMRRSSSALDFIDKNFQATWCYISPEGKNGCIAGYKPYAGTIDDIRDEATGVPIDWDRKGDLVWPEGTLGVAIANFQMWCKKSSESARCRKFNDLVGQMVEFQSLNKTGGILYSSKRIEGHFTQGEELASLAWLGYALIIKENLYEPRMAKYQKWIPW
jgi:phage tail protein X